MIELDEVDALDPAEVASPVTVDVDPAGPEIGHGRILPLVGGQRPYVYDVVFDGGARRVYADTVTGVLSAVVDDYEPAADEVDAAGSAEDRDRMEAALAATFQARHNHAHQVRVDMQTRVNTEAQADGRWDSLDEEERDQCSRGADGQVPVGVLYEVPLENPDGSAVVVDKGFWTHPDVLLCINRGDYDLFDPDFTPEPESLLSETDEQGRDVVHGGRWPKNLVILDPTDDDSYLESLEHAGLVEVTVRPVDLPDDTYLRAVDLGREMAEDPQPTTPSDES